MKNPLTGLPLALASVLAFAHLGVPTIAMAQDPSALPVWGGHDCLVRTALNGRVVPDTEWEPWPQAVATEVATRHECTGGIIQRPYSPGQIAEMRSGLRHVRI